MASVDRQTTRDLADTLLADARNYSFFRLLEHLHNLHGDDLEIRTPALQVRRRLRLQSHAGLGFPVSDIVHAERIGDGPEDRYSVRATFFGLHGSDSPLPGYYLDMAAYEYAQGTGIRPAFLDYFNHHLLSLLHQIWRKYRYYIRFQQQANDRFSRYVFSLIGLNDEQLRGTTPIPWSRLLSYAGVIASRSRSPGTVAGIVAHCFDLKQVHIREFEARQVPIPQAQRLALGQQNGRLGDSFLVGGHTRTRSSKFTLVIAGLDQPRFREFLPSGINFDRLCKLIEFLLRDVIAYDLELCLKPEEAPPFSLRRDHGSHLGWTSFIQNKAQQQAPVVRIKVRT